MSFSISVITDSGVTTAVMTMIQACDAVVCVCVCVRACVRACVCVNLCCIDLGADLLNVLQFIVSSL